MRLSVLDFQIQLFWAGYEGLMASVEGESKEHVLGLTSVLKSIFQSAWARVLFVTTDGYFLLKNFLN